MTAFAITEQHIEELAIALKLGATYEVACRAVGINARTWRRYQQHALELYENTLDKSRYPEAYLRTLQLILDLIVPARAQAEIELITRINQAGMADWRADAYLLEKSFYGWGKKAEPTEDLVTHDEIYDVSELSTHELAQLAGEIDDD
jgi:hypothetical protein